MANFNDFNPIPYILGICVLLFFGAIIGFSTIYTIDAGERAVLLTFGEVSNDNIGAGLHFKFPFVQSIVVYDARTQKYASDSEGASKDLQVVKITLATNYHIDALKVGDIYKTLGTDFDDVFIAPNEQEVVKAVTSTYSAEELITKRAEVALAMESALKERLAPRNIVVESISIVNFDFSDSFNQAIEMKVTAQQKKLQAENDLARIKVEAEQTVATAQGARDAKIANAEGDATAIKLVQDQLSASPQYVEYLRVTKWDGRLPTVTGGTTPLLDVSGLVK